MSRPPTLYEKIDSIADDRDFRAGLNSDFGLGYIADNLNKDYTIRPYQYDAINRRLITLKDIKRRTISALISFSIWLLDLVRHL